MKKNKNDYKLISDEKLMQLMNNGEINAFNVLFDRYKDRLLYYFFRMLGNSREKSQDFLQDVFYKVIDNQKSYDSSRQFSTWLFSIAHNMCKNEYRKQEIRKSVVNDENMEFYPGDMQEDEIDIKECTEKLYEELDKLDENRKTAFLLKYREGFKISEISNVLGCSEGTVKSTLHYTSKHLYQKLKNFQSAFIR